MIRWTDITSYSQSDRERIPRAYETEIDGLRIQVYRDRDDDRVYVRTYPEFVLPRRLTTDDLEAAKSQAIGVIEARLDGLSKAIERAWKETDR